MANDSCVFCDIIKGTVQASSVYENEAVIAIMDLRQASPGHVLVIPKGHYPDIYSVPPKAGAVVIECIIKVSKAVKKTFSPEGLSIWQSNGHAAFQEVPHVHFHVHPRWTSDGLLRVYPSKPPTPESDELKQYAAMIRENL